MRGIKIFRYERPILPKIYCFTLKSDVIQFHIIKQHISVIVTN